MATAAAVAAPVVGAAIAGAVTGAAGVGGIAGGIFSASRDPRVIAAAREFGDSISEEFFSSGGAFVQPVIDSLHTLRREFQLLNIGETFAKAAPYVDDFTEAIAGLVKNFLPGFNSALDNLGPIFHVISQELPEIGDALGDMVDNMSRSEGAAEGLQAAFEGINFAIRATGVVIAVLAEAFDGMLDALAKVGPPIEKFLTHMKFLSPLAPAAAKGMHELNEGIANLRDTSKSYVEQDKIPRSFSQTGDAAEEAKKQLADLEEQMQSLKRVTFESENATLNYEEAMDNLREAVKEGGRSLDVHSESGRKNRRTLQDIFTSAYAARDAIIAAGDGTETARRKGDKEFEKMKAAAYKLAIRLGFPKEVVDALFSKWDKIKSKNIQLTVTTRYVGGHPLPMQHGGEVFAGRAYVVGEKEPELFVPKTNGEILPKVPPMAYPKMLNQGGGTPAAPMTIRIESGGSQLDDLLVKILAKAIRAKGGSASTIGITN